VQIHILRAIRKKAAKWIAGSFPLNAVRVRALRAAGYSVGRSVYIGEGLHVTDELFTDTCSLSIGNRVAIAQRVMIVLASHPNESRLRTVVQSVFGHVAIGDDAWIGAAAIILPNVTIGAAAIVGAGAVVTKDVAPRTIVVGNPARPLKSVDDT
jgi:acetyltransferase-like isoleucine patch superfamily enzyme